MRTRKNSVFGHFLRSESRKTNKLEPLLGKVEGCRIFLNSDSQPNTLSWEICVNVCVHRYVLAIVALHRIAVSNIFRKFLRKPPCMESLLLNLQDVRLCHGCFPENYMKPIKHQSHKMVSHTQTICRLLPTNCLRMFDHFWGLALKGLSNIPTLCQLAKSIEKNWGNINIDTLSWEKLFDRIADLKIWNMPWLVNSNYFWRFYGQFSLIKLCGIILSQYLLTTNENGANIIVFSNHSG